MEFFLFNIYMMNLKNKILCYNTNFINLKYKKFDKLINKGKI